jgi:membrane-associated phospholipid phosphatase
MAGAGVPWALTPLVVLAALIAFASVMGRYHYAADAVVGAAVGVAAVILSERVLTG